MLRYVTAIPIPTALLKSERNPAKRIREEEEGQRSDAELLRTAAGWIAEAELSAVCPDDAGVYRFRRGYGGGTSGRRRLTAIKRAIYKLNNNNTVAIAA
ncbi:MAG: hypothetical protein SPF38_01000, partial [Dysosmobacter sp.]|nr:hypothetical protein [Dysosmobacter sp.]